MANEEKLIQAHTSPEHKGHYQTVETAGEQLKKLEKEKNVEAGAETEPNQQEAAERARDIIEQETVSAKEAGHEDKAGGEPEAPQTHSINRHEKQVEYQKTMASIQSQMSKPGSGFSKAIHQPVIEKTSQGVGSSLARPNAILAGSLVAFLAVLSVYLLARYNGFRLSGFETMAAFAVGWAIGILLDIIRVAFYGRRAT